MRQLDREATLAAMQEQIDDLTATCEAQQKQLDTQWQLLVELATRAGLPRPQGPGR